VEYPPRSPDISPLDFYLWGSLKNTVRAGKPRSLHDLSHRIEIASAAIAPVTLREVCHSVARHQQCIGLVVDILNISEF
jgi:hypothetical protein